MQKSLKEKSGTFSSVYSENACNSANLPSDQSSGLLITTLRLVRMSVFLVTAVAVSW